MIQKYLKFKDKQLLLVGLTWIFMTSVWWGDAISFIMMLIGGETNYLLDPLYFFINNGLVVLLFFTWPRTFGDLVLGGKKKLRKFLIWIIAIWGIIIETVFLIIFFIDYRLIGDRIGPYSAEWCLFVYSYVFLGTMVFTISGIIFSYTAIKSYDPNIQLKGKWLMGAFIMIIAGAVLEVFFVEIEEINLVARILFIFAALSFYIGFVLPDFVKKLFKIEKK
ncbi:MAG: hypothetical protein ACFFAS_17935 [Promethearchaeota archaeon]